MTSPNMERENKGAGHTPGPWDYCGSSSDRSPCFCGYIFGAGGNVYVAKCLSLDDDVDPVANDEMRKANARLIAAAPELLEALEALLHELKWVNEQLDLMPDDYAEAQSQASRAIAKATGAA
jgi:hypothetical protein